MNKEENPDSDYKDEIICSVLFSWKKQVLIPYIFTFLCISVYSYSMDFGFKWNLILAVGVLSFHYLLILQFTAKNIILTKKQLEIEYLVNLFLRKRKHALENIKYVEFNSNSGAYGASFLRVVDNKDKINKYSIQTLSKYHGLTIRLKKEGIKVIER